MKRFWSIIILIASFFSFFIARGQDTNFAVLPYFCGFEDSVDNSQWFFSHNGPNEWYLGSAVTCTGENSMYISQDGGVTNSFSRNQQSLAWAYRDIYMDSTYKEFFLSFDVHNAGAQNIAFVGVSIGNPIDFDENAAPLDSNEEIVLLEEIYDLPNWTHKQYIIDSTHVGIQRIYLRWYNTYNSSYPLNNIYNPPAAIDNILLKGVKCSMPMHLASTNTHNSATLSWVPGYLGPAESYTVAYKKNTDTSYFEITIEDTVLVLTGLEPASKYSWKVRANCSEINMSDWSEEEQFITYASLPYFCGFENLQENSPWLMYNDPSNNVNQWAIGSATQNTGNSALYISSNSGQSYAYNTGRTSAAWACLDIYLEPGHSEYQLSFDCQGMGQYGQDYMRVYLGNPVTISDMSAFPDSNMIQLTEDINLLSVWTHYGIPIDSSWTGYRRLYLYWYNNYNSGVNPPVAVDNIEITGNGCRIPVDLTNVMVLDSMATVSWSNCSEQNTMSHLMQNYILAYKTVMDTTYTEILLADTIYSITGLSPLTEYMWKVRTVCYYEYGYNSAWSSEKTFHTTQVLGHLPYLCSFDQNDENDRWILKNDNYHNIWAIGNAIGCDDQHALYISNDMGLTNNYYNTIFYPDNATSSVWAYRDIFFATGYPEYHISFDFKGMGQNNADYMKVFVGDAVLPSGAGTPTGSTQLGDMFVGIDEWQHYSFSLDSSYSGVKRLFFLWNNDNANGEQPPAAIDNIAVTASFCEIPQNLVCIDLKDHFATVSWNPSETSEDVTYTVSVRKKGDYMHREISVTDTICLIDSLMSSTYYYWKVRSQCSDTESSAWSNEMIIQTPASRPYHCGFEDFDERAAWHLTSNTVNKWCFGSAVRYSGNYGLYISNDGGASYTYSGTHNNTYAWAYRDIYLDSAYRAYRLIVPCKTNGEAYSDYFSLFMGPPSVPTNDSTPPGAFKISLMVYPAWFNIIRDLDSTQAGLKRLYFLWQNDYFTVNNPPAAVDNISIEGTNCLSTTSNLNVIVIDTMALLSWSSSGSDMPESYTVRYKAFTDSLYTEVIVTNTSCAIGNLTPSTNYEWMVCSNCSATERGFWSTRSTFQTTENTAHLPYFCGFEDTVENSRWVFVNGNYVNKWYIDTAVNHGGEASLYVSNNGGISNTYANNSTSQIWAYRDFYFEPGHSDYQISFDIRSFGERYNNNPCDYASVFLGPPATPSGNSVPQGAVRLGTYFYVDSVWSSFSQELDSSFAGPQRLYFLWRNDGLDGINPPCAVDNIQITYANCMVPTQMSTFDITENSATLTWISNIDTVFVAYKSLSDNVFTEIVTTGTSCHLDSLTPSTIYVWKVRNLCSDASTIFWSDQQMFRTNCGKVTVLPYTESFDTYGTDNYPWCWTRLNTAEENYQYIVMNTSGNDDQSYSSPGFLILMAQQETYNMSILPEFDTIIPINGLQISFYYNTDSRDNKIIMGVLNTPTDETSFVPLDTVQLEYYQYNQWNQMTAQLSNYTGNGHYIALKYISNGLSNSGIDNVVVEEAPQDTTGIAQQNKDDFVKVYPNPTNGKCFIYSKQYTIQEVEVFDLMGKSIKKIEVDDYQAIIDLTSCQSGIYFIRIYTTTAVVTKRVIVRIE